MARARNLKPSLFKNEVLGVEDPLLTLLFQSLWCLADREGRLEDRPLRIKAETFPYREGIDINGYLTELERLKFIDRYLANGFRVIQILNFKKHQNPHKTEKASQLPEKPMESGSCEITVKEPLNNGTSRADSLLPLTDSLNTDTPKHGAKKVEANSATTEITPAASVCIAIKRVYEQFNKQPHDIKQTLPKFIACIEAGATEQEFVEAAIEALSKTPPKGFAYICATVFNRREEAGRLPKIHEGGMPKQNSLSAANRGIFGDSQSDENLIGGQVINAK